MLPIALLFALIDGFLISAMISGYVKAGQKIPLNFFIFIVVFFSIHLIPFWMWLSNIITAGRKFKNVEYCITDRKVLIQGGLRKIEIDLIPFEVISTVFAKVNSFEKLLGIGDVRIYSSKLNTLYTLNDIAQPKIIADKLREIVSSYKKSLKDNDDKEDEDDFI